MTHLLLLLSMHILKVYEYFICIMLDEYQYFEKLKKKIYYSNVSEPYGVQSYIDFTYLSKLRHDVGLGPYYTTCHDCLEFSYA